MEYGIWRLFWPLARSLDPVQHCWRNIASGRLGVSSLGISKGVIFNVGLVILVSGEPYVVLPLRIRAGFDISFSGRSINKYMIFAY